MNYIYVSINKGKLNASDIPMHAYTKNKKTEVDRQSMDELLAYKRDTIFQKMVKVSSHACYT
jgi:hypothetical protein